jgi:NhaP-type Na+/H+ or K+/H+ antiporter
MKAPVDEKVLDDAMSLLLIFSLVLLIGVLVSSLAARSVLSTSVLFLVAGFLAGPEAFDLLDVSPNQESLALLVRLALFSVLFTDGMRVGWGDLRSAWHLPGRALLLGMPLTMLFTTAAAHVLLDISWLPAALIGAILSPTDPVFASAIVGRREVPPPLRQLLNVESGI